MTSNKRPKKPTIKETEAFLNTPINQSEFLSGMGLNDANTKYLNLCKSGIEISCNVYLRFKKGDQIPVTLYSISNDVLVRGKKAETYLEKNKLMVKLSPDTIVPLSFLKALAFVPCPDQTFKSDYIVGFIDSNPANVSLKNLAWFKRS